MIGILVSIAVFALLFWLIMRGSGDAAGLSSGRDWQKRMVVSKAEGISTGNKSRVGILSGDTRTEEETNHRTQARTALKQLREKEKRRDKDASMVGIISEMIACSGYSFSPQIFIVWMGVISALVFCVLIFSIGLSVFPAFLIGAVTGFFGPRWWLQMTIARRRKKFLVQFTDALDMIVRGAKSGLPLIECLRAIARETEDPLSSEFQMVVDRLALGSELKACMDVLYARMQIPEVSFFAVILVIQNKTGGNLSEALGNLSSVIRARALMHEKVKALSSESKASSVVLVSLPFLISGFIYMTQPEYIAPLFETSLGNNLLFAAAAMMGTGIFIIRKISNIRV